MKVIVTAGIACVNKCGVSGSDERNNNIDDAAKIKTEKELVIVADESCCSI
jgi:hypothetical protein